MSCPECATSAPQKTKKSWLVAAVLIAALAAVGLLSVAKRATGGPAAQVVPINVNEDGFKPSSVMVAAGKPLELEFTRTSEKTCADSVVFPELNIKKPLPLNQAVRVSVPTQQARTLAFTCGMGHFRSSVVIN